MITEKIGIFLETADSLSFSAVAQKHYTTQSTISRQIRALEEEWDVQLFERTNRGLRLTPGGAIMLGCCRRMEQICSAALLKAQNLEVGKRDRIRLGFLETLDVNRIFMPVLQEFSGKYPDLDITVAYHSFEKLRKGLEKGDFDLIYTFDFDVKYIREEVVFDPLFPIKPVFVISERHPMFSREQLDVADLAKEEFFLPEARDAPGREEDLRMILSAYGIRNSRIRFMPNLESVLFQMRTGRGVAMSDDASAVCLEKGVRRIELDKYRGSLNLVAVWCKNNLNPMLPLLLRYCVDLQEIWPGKV